MVVAWSDTEAKIHDNAIRVFRLEQVQEVLVLLLQGDVCALQRLAQVNFDLDGGSRLRTNHDTESTMKR